MARQPKPIISPTGSTTQGAEISPRLIRAIDTGLGIQRPVVLAHIQSIRRRNPDANPQQLIKILERRYLAAVTTGGAAVGATAVVPGIGTGITLALSGIETAGFLEATALFAQSVAEVHGIPVADPERARALIMTMMLGSEGTELVRQLAGQFTGGGVGAGRTAYWGELVTNSIPRAILLPLGDRLKSMFIHRFAVGAGASILSKSIPFGIGAVVGGVGNQIFGRRVVTASQLAFGQAPFVLPPELELKQRAIILGEQGPGAFTRARGAVTGGVAHAADLVRRRGSRSGNGASSTSDDGPLDEPAGSPATLEPTGQ